MSRPRSRFVIAATMSLPVVVGLGVAGSSEATTPVTTDPAAEPGATSPAEPSGIEILRPHESWGGLTRSELEAQYWQWIVSFPDASIPWFDTTGERCGYGQSGPVFMLAPTGREVTCVVAEGTAIWVAVANTECSTLEPEPLFGRTEDELRACGSEEIDEVTDHQARVDGVEVADLDAYRTASPMFTLTLPANNVWELQPGVGHAVAEGYSFLITPPPPGEYEIAWTARYPADTQVRPMSTVNLVVAAPQVIQPPES